MRASSALQLGWIRPQSSPDCQQTPGEQLVVDRQFTINQVIQLQLMHGDTGLFSKLRGDDPSALIGLPLLRLVAMLESAGVEVV